MAGPFLMDHMKIYTREWKVEEFLETFPTTLHYKFPEYRGHPLVFWSHDDLHHRVILQQQQGFQNYTNNNDSFSADVDSRGMMISDKIKHAFICCNFLEYRSPYIIQFWAPVVTSNGRRFLSASGQPFAVKDPWKPLSKYRLRCTEHQYSIISDAPTATAFLNCLPEFVFFENLKGASPLVDFALECDLSHSYMLPICLPSQTTSSSSSCIGVLEISTTSILRSSKILIEMIRALKEVGLGVFQIQERIPYQIIDGLKPARDEIEHALQMICETSNTPLLAQVWIRDYHMPFSSYSEATSKKQMLSLKLTGYLGDTEFEDYEWDISFNEYYRLCDMFPLEMAENFVGKTLEDYKPRFCTDVSKLRRGTLGKRFFYYGDIRFAICLNSIHTGRFCYAFEFMWRDNSDVKFAEDNSDSDVKSADDDSDSDVKFVAPYIDVKRAEDNSDVKFAQDDSDSDVKFVEDDPDVKIVEEILSQLELLLPSFKLASGAKLGDELDFINVGDSTATETKILKIFQGKRLSLIHGMLEEETRIPVSMVLDYVEPLEANSKTNTIPLSREVTEQQFVNTDKIEAAEKLKEPDDESVVPDVENSARNEKTLQENIGKKTMVENCMAPSQRKYKTAPIHVSKEAIEHQYGNTMKKAAENLKVSISTLKRKCKDFGISEWQGCPRAAKRKVNDSSHQNNKSEEDIGAIEESYEVNKNKDTLTIKAEYEGDMIKFHLCISEATFITIEEEIGKKFKLTHGTYKLKYLDEDKDWILLASDEDMSDCIKGSRNLGRIVLRMCVLPSTQPISS